MIKLPPYVTRDLVQERLPMIFPEGSPNRNYCIRELAASTVFSMLYIGAIEEAGVYLGPIHVYRMTSEQAALTSTEDRIGYRTTVLRSKISPPGMRWYADNTREPIRDETLREGLVAVGAVLSLSSVPTTSSRPRYCLQKDFADLFQPRLSKKKLKGAIDSWQKKYLSKSALTRLSLAGLGSKNRIEQVFVVFPNKETRHLSAGPSAEISKAVIEVFATAFLESPVVIWLSTSDNKVVFRDNKIAASIGLNIQADKDLPDIILADLAPEDPLLVFIEVVATDGAVTERRQKAIYALTDAAGFSRTQVAFITAYLDRESVGFTKTVRGLTWNSFVWFVSEPDKIVVFKDGVCYLSKIIDTSNL